MKSGNKNNPRIPLALLLTWVVLQAHVAALAQQFGDFSYTNIGNAITITGYTGRQALVDIPTTINGVPVVSIWNWAFSFSTNPTSITIPEGVTNIGDYAFDGCSNLTNVTIPNSVTSIGLSAFEACSGLASVALPTNLPSIPGGTFNSCSSLASVSIPNSVGSIGPWAFWGCSNLTGLTFPSSLTSIWEQAFNSCATLTNVTLPSSVTTISVNPFAYCSGLVAIHIDPANKDYAVRDGVLFDQSLTTLIACPAGRTGHYSIPDGVATVAASAFAGCSFLTGIRIPNTVTNLAELAFADCASLTNITIPASVTTFVEAAFLSCTNLTGVFFSGNPPTLYLSIFEGDPNVTVYYLPGARGWGTTFAGRPAWLWNPFPQAPSRRANEFGFDITGTRNLPIVIEASLEPISGLWIALQTSTLTNGLLHFTDPLWTQFPSRFYRIRSP